MSLVLNTVRAFPRGRTTEELLVLLGASFSHDKRLAAVAELDQLMRDGLVEKARDGRWRAKRAVLTNGARNLPARGAKTAASEQEILHAAAANFASLPVADETLDTEDLAEPVIDPQALLRYWRSALRADPRGATTQVLDKHGIEWTLISGRGPVLPNEGQRLRISISLAALDPGFQEALIRREGNENALAVGWPMAISRRGGLPIFQPVGMLAASWTREGESLVLSVDANDVLVNPDWVKGAARLSGWKKDDLADLFHADNTIGLRGSDFLDRVRTAVASQVRGRITGEDLASQLDGSAQGIYDSAAIFLPTDSSFTAGAARDLDAIGAWPRERLSRSALGAVLGIESAAEIDPVPAIDAVPLNKEQLRAVQGACELPLTVVTGPPGTGKSQAIVSMAASVLAAGGSVLVASKNHQALDAVEERLGALASGVPFSVRTLNPNDETDTGFSDALKQLIGNENTSNSGAVDVLAVSELVNVASQRRQAVDAVDRIAELECEIADVLERIELREARGRPESSAQTPSADSQGFFRRLLLWLHSSMIGRPAKASMPRQDVADRRGMSLRDLHALLVDLRAMKEELGEPVDPIELGERIREATGRLLPRLLAVRTHLTEELRRELAELSDDWQFSGGKGQPPADLAKTLVSHRPLWLASILGTPRRIPLDDGLFDLVIFDEASQCDIATAIPLFARAKRAVVVGDDRQLSFIAQLGQAQDRNLMQAQGLPVAGMGRFAQSRRSLFDLASRTPGARRITLRHQYRSAGPIVDYISDNFYGGQLQTSYDPRSLVVPKGAKPGLAWEHVPAPAVAQTGNVNPAEVAAIVKHLEHLLKDEGYEGTIGVITPFRAQVAAMEASICQAIDEPKRIACELKVGTVDGFQGQERDLVLFSPCVGPRSPQSGLTFFQRDTRRLNVAISRAKAVALIFGDLEFARSGQSSPLRRLAAMATEPRGRVGESVFDSDWERKVFHALKGRGLDPQPQFEIAGRRLDFALFGSSGVKLDLEVDGRKWHESQDGRRKTTDLWRDHQLKSLGWRVRRFWVDELAKDMEGCLDRVEQDLS
ncbi:AAA domain-containing protein [Phaeobacter sp. J2-8]|uniref:AAA domain-containing protein n=1 Tax=Phaeobacter sp. J2-8 TaxID=2931394 RepID=UPI001FD51025|nr:AAA domain-containing protein [Phaeobacter sp. J2-8]MCJ7872108.1 AAA domain-containing protein [Phaeobacter sp. J2-8]